VPELWTLGVMKTFLKRLAGSRKVKYGFLLFLILYVGSYTVLSLHGNYEHNVGSLAKIGICIASMSDRYEWQPRLIIVTGFPDSYFSVFANPSGYFFMPLVYVDRLLIHRTKYIDYEH
jgi:hypothetical protein